MCGTMLCDLLYLLSVFLSMAAASGKSITVDYAVTGGTATDTGTDYTLASGTLTFTAGTADGQGPSRGTRSIARAE